MDILPVPPANPGTSRTTRATLNSWKQVAQYFGLGVRTVQRYEQEFELPIRRLSRGRRNSVRAYPHELDSWLLRKTRHRKPGPERQSGEVTLISFKQNLARLRGLLEENRRLLDKTLVLKRGRHDPGAESPSLGQSS